MRRFFRAIDTQQFQRLFVDWIKAWLNPEVANKVIAIDGKTLRSSHDGAHSAIHLVSAFASEAGIVLGQVKTNHVGVRRMRKSAGWDNSVLANILSQIF